MRHRWYYSKEKEEMYQSHHQNKDRYFIHHQGLLIYTLNLDYKELCTEIPINVIPISSMQGNYFFTHKDFVTPLLPPSYLIPFNITSQNSSNGNEFSSKTAMNLT